MTLLCAGQTSIISIALLRLRQLGRRQGAQQQQTLDRQARIDELTGLPNRRDVLARVDQLLADSRSRSAAPLSVLFCELNGFKPINDGLGHEAGDEVLRVVARHLSAATRQGDVVGRIGGDEFQVVLPETGTGDAGKIAERVESEIAVPIGWRGRDLRVGVAMAEPGDRQTADLLIARADTAMYTRKRAMKQAMRWPLL